MKNGLQILFAGLLILAIILGIGLLVYFELERTSGHS